MGFNNMSLDLSHQKIHKIEPSLFVNYEHIEALYLQYNLVSIIANYFLVKIPSIRRVNASNNRIHIVQKHAFKGLDRLESLDLSYNEIRRIDVTDLKELPSLKYLYFEENPWYCDCRLELLSKWRYESRSQDEPKVLISPSESNMACSSESIFILKHGKSYPLKLDVFLGMDETQITAMHIYNFSGLDVGSQHVAHFCENFSIYKEKVKYQYILGFGIPSILIMWALTAFFIIQIRNLQGKRADGATANHNYEKEGEMLTEALKSVVIPDYEARFDYRPFVEKELLYAIPKPDKEISHHRFLSGSSLKSLGKVIGENIDYFIPYLGHVGEDRDIASRNEFLPSISLPKVTAMYEKNLKERLCRHVNERSKVKLMNGSNNKYKSIIENIFKNRPLEKAPIIKESDDDEIYNRAEYSSAEYQNYDDNSLNVDQSGEAYASRKKTLSSEGYSKKDKPAEIKGHESNILSEGEEKNYDTYTKKEEKNSEIIQKPNENMPSNIVLPTEILNDPQGMDALKSKLSTLESDSKETPGQSEAIEKSEDDEDSDSSSDED